VIEFGRIIEVKFEQSEKQLLLSELIELGRIIEVKFEQPEKQL
jgi:hypothetical protein